MKKLKKYFETPKKAVVSLVCIAVVLVILGSGAVCAATEIAENTSIGKAAAKSIALADAGVAQSAVWGERIEFDFEHGRFVYEVDFKADGVEYEYTIRASDGAIIKRDMEKDDDFYQTQSVSQSQQPSGSENQQQTQTSTGSQTQQNGEQVTAKPENDTANKPQTNDGSQQATAKISLETAKSTALTDAGVSGSDATFTKEKLDWDDGIYVYDIEFYTATAEYDYEIDASTGAIHEKSSEKLEGTSGGQQGGAISYIGVDKAKSIAVGHAGLSVSDVVFSKAKLDDDDGYIVYEVEFYKDGMEYEYSIDAFSGSIIEYDVDIDD